MWQCECGEFNNEESAYCVRCNKLRVIKERARHRQQGLVNTDTIFRRIQDFILLDIAVTGLVVVYCFWRASQKVRIETVDGELYIPRGIAFEAVIPLLLVVILQFGLMVHLLRVLYRAAITSERNSIFLQRIYEKYEGLEEEEEEESATEALVKPPAGPTARERRGPPPSGPPDEGRGALREDRGGPRERGGSPRDRGGSPRERRGPPRDRGRPRNSDR